jgi:membrane protease subunit HflC
VRNSNAILDQIAAKKSKLAKASKEEAAAVEEEITGEIESIQVGREKLSEIIVKSAADELAQLGIQLIDLQLRRISYEKSVEAKVYERMISERQRIAQKIRSIGQGEKAKIEGRLKLDLQRITSEAYKRAEIIKGKAEAKSTLIYAQAFKQGEDFYAFQRRLQAYEKALGKKTHFILSSDSNFLKLLK